MNDFPNSIVTYNKGYFAGIERVINKLIHLEILRPEDAPMLAMACLSPDPEPDLFDLIELFAKKTTP